MRIEGLLKSGGSWNSRCSLSKMPVIKRIDRLLIANRGEIAVRFTLFNVLLFIWLLVLMHAFSLFLVNFIPIENFDNFGKFGFFSTS